MNSSKKKLGALRLVLFILTLATIAMAFLPMLEVERSVSLSFDSVEDVPAPEVSVRTIDGMWFLAVCSVVRCLLVTLRKPAADAVSVLLAVSNSAWVWFVPRLHGMISEIFSNANYFRYDPIMDSGYRHSYALAPLAWVLIGVNVLCAVLTVAAMVCDDAARAHGGNVNVH